MVVFSRFLAQHACALHGADQWRDLCDPGHQGDARLPRLPHQPYHLVTQLGTPGESRTKNVPGTAWTLRAAGAQVLRLRAAPLPGAGDGASQLRAGAFRAFRAFGAGRRGLPEPGAADVCEAQGGGAGGAQTRRPVRHLQPPQPQSAPGEAGQGKGAKAQGGARLICTEAGGTVSIHANGKDEKSPEIKVKPRRSQGGDVRNLLRPSSILNEQSVTQGLIKLSS